MNDTTSGKKPSLPRFNTDEEAEKFVEEADLTEYDLSGEEMHFEFEKKTTQVNMRMPEKLLMAIKARATARGIPYQRLIRETLEKSLR